jgi:dTDP-4-dehydrorhamnose reductase
MKFLVTGSSGLIGSQVVKDLVEQNYTVYSCYHSEKPLCGIPTMLDLTDNDKIIQKIQETKPDVIIHLAAMTNVDLCETEKELSLQINSKATEILAKQAAKQNSFFIYVSTDYVFDGVDGMKKEDDLPNPLGFYGKSKLDGESTLDKLKLNWCIVRTSTPFGINPKKKSFPL